MMIDKIKINVKEPIKRPDKLTSFKESSDHETGEVSFKGRLGNLFLRGTNNGFTIENSLSRYYLGDGFTKNLSLDESKKAIEKLSDELEIILDPYKLCIIEFGSIIELDERVKRVLDGLLVLNGFKKDPMDSGVYFNSNNVRIALYDVVKRWKNQGIKRDRSLDNSNLLKYENRFLNTGVSLRKTGNTVSEILEPRSWNWMLDKWRDLYEKIHKSNKIIDPVVTNSGVKAFRNSLALMGLEKVGLEKVMDELSYTDPQTRYNLRKALKELRGSNILTKESNVFIELDEKINQIYEEKRV